MSIETNGPGMEATMFLQADEEPFVVGCEATGAASDRVASDIEAFGVEAEEQPACTSAESGDG